MQDSWHNALKFKCKYERTKFADDGEVALKRQKFGKQPRNQEAANGNESAKRVCRQPDALLLGAGEDDFSIEGHIKSMKRELQKDVPDMERIEDSMSRTFASRRQWVAAEHPSVQDILRRYPALERTEEIFREFERFGGDAPLQTVTAVAQLQMATVLDVAAKRVEKATWDILERVDTCSKEDQHLMTTLAFLVTLPRTVKEQASSFVKDVAPWFSKYPSVIWNGDPDDVGICMVQVEDQLIKADHPAHAILVAFCLHWVAGICYQPGARGFYALLEHLLGLQATKPTTMVVTALSAMKETLKKKNLCLRHSAHLN
ncbi:uncharacterized protein LOC115316560 [Ixodes scapularis]|uniref:uncharacterized protein LOC115316560 n=1 Tax=Ixodes scapularis TaxID=6945 RepID=UPI001A9FAF4F|nr:uncharacterized protein LOC115316560 [Ixodes scapularis]